jgi:hypothetical protein
MSLEQFVLVTSSLRQQVANRPLMLFAGLLALLALWPVRRKPIPEPQRSAIGFPAALALLALTMYTVLVVWYVRHEQYADAAEPTIAALARLFEAGRPIYHGIDSAERYSHIYGPLAFIIPAWSLELFGHSIVTSKISGAAAGVLALGVVFGLTYTTDRPRNGLLLTGLFAVLCLMFQNVSFWIRPDSLEVLVAGMALLAVVRIRGTLAAAILVGLATGILAGLKTTGPLYASPALALLASQRRTGSLALAGFIAVAVGVYPFLVYDGVSFANYALWIRTSAKNGLAFLTLKQNVEWALFLLIPLVPALLSGPVQPRARWFYGSLTSSMALVAVAASKPGAGPYHLLPFVPAIMYAASMSLRNPTPDFIRDRGLRLGRLAFVLSVGIVALLQICYFLWSATRSPAAQIAADVEHIAEAHPSARIEMGYSAENEAFSYVRPVLVFRQGVYLFDAPAIQEYQMSNVAFPAAAIQAIERCDVNLWLFPKNGAPFSLRNRYPSTGHVPLFPSEALRAFNQAYRRIESTDYFDIWACRNNAR